MKEKMAQIDKAGRDRLRGELEKMLSQSEQHFETCVETIKTFEGYGLVGGSSDRMKREAQTVAGVIAGLKFILEDL